ncbi:putative short-chain dehydrogenase [Xylariomycetidae sp. FL0641]|nr:putative short-chain dehydrogenase [Xylariomycetidae sp. FL0641]
MGFLWSQLFARLPYPTGDYSGKTIIITGSNTGLGKEAARHYARLGASRLILAARDEAKGHEAKADIVATTHCSANVVQMTAEDNETQVTVNLVAPFYLLAKLRQLLALRHTTTQSQQQQQAVAVDPGLCWSDLARKATSWAFWLVLARSAEVGSRTLVHAGGQGGAPRFHGQYPVDCRVGAPSEVCTGEGSGELQRRVWEELMVKLEAVQPGVTRNF